MRGALGNGYIEERSFAALRMTAKGEFASVPHVLPSRYASVAVANGGFAPNRPGRPDGDAEGKAESDSPA